MCRQPLSESRVPGLQRQTHSERQPQREVGFDPVFHQPLVLRQRGVGCRGIQDRMRSDCARERGVEQGKRILTGVSLRRDPEGEVYS